MESYTRQLNKIRKSSYRCAIVAAVAAVLLLGDWVYLVSTKHGGGLLLISTETEINVLDLFDYIDQNGELSVDFATYTPGVYIGSTGTPEIHMENDGSEITIFQFNIVSSDIPFNRSTYMLAERYKTPRWARTSTSKYEWVDATGWTFSPIHHSKLPPLFIPLALELAQAQEPEIAEELTAAINDSVSNRVSLLGLAHNTVAVMLLITITTGCAGFVYLFNKSRG